MLVFSDGTRYRTEPYAQAKSRGMAFSVAEKVGKGVLVTDFGGSGEVIDQNLFEYGVPLDVLTVHLGAALELSGEPYKKVEVDIFCKRCSKDSTAVRELDIKDAQSAGTVPVAPIFVCSACRTRYYSMTDSYLERLISRNEEMFKREELTSMKDDAGAFMRELQGYIIRIFASKRVFRLEIKK